ncbi:hypothetical protein SAMN04487968_10581 [Nocardioides terrae]|uniref:Uncharacterized protein n=1 Tax=Nocardioides terrae TaxID=574651 RepID=A0A1I1I025_9ACTN|nr:hypothetical protein [Nocardioides terrae]SFC29677.1 hypothetical protein SAMN04487968_10581 [Nocardioides terrae]
MPRAISLGAAAMLAGAMLLGLPAAADAASHKAAPRTAGSAIEGERFTA